MTEAEKAYEEGYEYRTVEIDQVVTRVVKVKLGSTIEQITDCALMEAENVAEIRRGEERVSTILESSEAEIKRYNELKILGQ